MAVDRPVVFGYHHVLVLAQPTILHGCLIYVLLSKQLKQVRVRGVFLLQIQLVCFVDLDDFFAAGSHAIVEELRALLVLALSFVVSVLVRLSLQLVVLLLRRFDLADPRRYILTLLGVEL